ncbi:MAG: lectin-like protein [Thermoguttaceae bacterium]|jgi:hypothetical protein
MKKLLLIVIIGLNMLIGSTTVVNAYEWFQYNGHSYTLTSNWSNWEDAEQEAVNLGGNLVTINDDNENTWLTNTFENTYTKGYPDDPEDNIAWIGYYSNDDGNSWQWISGEPVTYYRHDYPYWPDGGTKAYLHLAHLYPNAYVGMWNAHDLHEEYNYPKGIVEVVPEPSTLALLSMGVICLAFYARRRRG